MSNMQRNFTKLSAFISHPSSRDVLLKLISNNVVSSIPPLKNVSSFSISRPLSTGRPPIDTGPRSGAGPPRSMREKVERRMQKETGKTRREIRRASNIRKKLMTEEERLVFNLKRAKKKVALLLQKLKKYDLPELPSPKHDPELLTSEQLQAYKKIGFRNKNYVPVGVRGVFGGVVQNMHLHWKFHETVQVCCDNFPKEKIKEMSSMLARLSGGIVINIHNLKTVIMYRGRNYRQPKNLIPINTLTKRKALFKARFEQALESQKLNIKKYEQDLRRKGYNPEDPVAVASIQRVASTFFNAIDRKEGSPYVFNENEPLLSREEDSKIGARQFDPAEDSDQEELDRFIAEIEDAADKEWAAEEEAEKEELSRIRYWNRENTDQRFRRNDESDEDENVSYDNDRRGVNRNYNVRSNNHQGFRGGSSRMEEDDSGSSDENDVHDRTNERGKRNYNVRANNHRGFSGRDGPRIMQEEGSGSGDEMSDDLEWQSESDSNEAGDNNNLNMEKGNDVKKVKSFKQLDENWDSDSD
ncbi:CRM-domain containing factor CFM9, mitochondrial [Impatiens glandulifera]|uniref:CRM-domain containing factor CFM9, mitochondrial n=1 Tax=Impatiens glandulifera TaxID=253017 RepID=UPI001FB0A467|nr:CRM-domain containing factor CFM9, mitochondrial [Impatiens glandulifera]